MFANLNNTWKYSIIVYFIICLLLLPWTILQFFAIIMVYAVIQNLFVIIYLLNVLVFICHDNSLSPSPSLLPLSTINCTTRTFKNICIYLYHICHIHVFHKLRKYLIQHMQFKGISNQFTIALIINFVNFKILIIMVVVRQQLKSLCSISMT